MSHMYLPTTSRPIKYMAMALALTLALGGCGVQAHSAQSDSAPNSATEPTSTKDECAEVEAAANGYAHEESLSMSRPDEPWVDYNTEEYASIDETGFVSAATRPLSTVSADVDTASYCNIRRMLHGGQTPEEIDTGAVRIEEMLNYFAYDYKTPTGDDLFAMTSHVGDCPWNSETKLVTLGFATAPEAASATSKGSNLVFLIDISGSMDSADKLDLLKDSFDELVGHLGNSDRVSIVTYANGEDVVLEGASGSDRRKIMRAVNRLQADGSTNGEAGLQMAYQVAERNFIEGGVNRIVMASDGDLNVGMSSESDLHDYVDKQRETGIYLSVLGFGSGNYKDNKMETLADHGNGSYHYIDCVEEAQRVLGTKLTANLVPLCDDVKVQVEFNPAAVKGYRLIGYENRAMADEDFLNDEKDAGDVGPSAQFSVAYEVALADSKQEITASDLKYDQEEHGGSSSDEWLTASIRYQPADGSDAREQHAVVSKSAWQESPAADWHFQAAVIEFGMLLRDSEFAGTADAGQIRKLLDASDASKSEERKGFAELVDLAYE